MKRTKLERETRLRGLRAELQQATEALETLMDHGLSDDGIEEVEVLLSQMQDRIDREEEDL